MPGRVVRLLVAEQAEVEAGQGIVVVEAMKMQNEIKSPKKGIVRENCSSRRALPSMPATCLPSWSSSPGGLSSATCHAGRANWPASSLTSVI